MILFYLLVGIALVYSAIIITLGFLDVITRLDYVIQILNLFMEEKEHENDT